MTRKEKEKELKSAYKKTGGHFFDKDTEEAFKSKIEEVGDISSIDKEGEKIYFITSEVFGIGKRMYSTREWAVGRRTVRLVGSRLDTLTEAQKLINFVEKAEYKSNCYNGDAWRRFLKELQVLEEQGDIEYFALQREGSICNFAYIYSKHEQNYGVLSNIEKAIQEMYTEKL